MCVVTAACFCDKMARLVIFFELLGSLVEDIGQKIIKLNILEFSVLCKTSEPPIISSYVASTVLKRAIILQLHFQSF